MMRKKTVFSRIILWTFIVLGAGCILYAGFVGYVVYSFSSGCGMIDGPFEAQHVTFTVPDDTIQVFDVDGGKLLLMNDMNHSPRLSLEEKGKTLWTIEMDVSKRKGYESCRLWKAEQLEFTNTGDPIRFHFIGRGTYGAEGGTMRIDRDDGDNEFCLNW